MISKQVAKHSFCLTWNSSRLEGKTTVHASLHLKQFQPKMKWKLKRPSRLLKIMLPSRQSHTGHTFPQSQLSPVVEQAPMRMNLPSTQACNHLLHRQTPTLPVTTSGKK